MSDTSLSRFFSNVISSGLGKLSTVVFGILCMLVYAHWMTQADYGGFVLLQVLLNLGVSFGEFGMDTGITRFIARTDDMDERRKFINTGLLFRIGCMILMSLIIFVFRDSLYQILGGYIPQQLLLYLPFLLVIEGLLSFYSFVLEGMLNFKILAIISFVYGLASLVLTVILVIPFGMGAHGLVLARLIPELLVLIIAILATKIKLLLEFDRDFFKRLFKFSIPIYGNNLLAFAYNRADTLIIGYFFGPAEIAIFEFARRIPESLEMLSNSFIAVYYPMISSLFGKGQKEKIADLINHTNRITGFLGGMLVILAFGFGEWGFRLLFSEKYMESVPAFTILMIVFIFKSLDSNLGYSLVAIGESAKPLFINLFRFGFIFACYFILIPRFKIVGAVLSSLIGLIVVNPLNVHFLLKQFIHVRMRDYLKPLFLMALGIIPFYFWGNNIPLSLVLLTAFCTGCYFWNIVRMEDIDIIRREAAKLLARFKPGTSH
jgi:teichuronic acid exporter